MKFTVCIPAFRPTTLVAAIDSIRQQTWQDWELIIVGQGSDAHIKTAVRDIIAEDSRIHYLHLEKRGTCRARNAGISVASGDVIALIDDDCKAKADWLETIADMYSRRPDIGLVSGALVAPVRTKSGFAVCPTINPPEALYDPIESGHKPPSGWGWMGCNVAISRDVIARVGLFDEQMGPGTHFPAAEDTDYLLRLEAQGIKMFSTPRAIVYHTHGYRYGLRAVFRQQRAYARGDGGAAAKLTLLGDPRGKEWVTGNIRDLKALLFSPRLHRVPLRMLRLWYFLRSYHKCLREYRVDLERCMLYPAPH